MSKPVRILGIAGSLRRDSYNRATLRAATELVPEGATIEIFELDGAIATARAQYHLRQMMVFLNMFPVNQPEVMIGNAQDRFDAEGNLTDETTKDFIRQLLHHLVGWTRRVGQTQEV